MSRVLYPTIDFGFKNISGGEAGQDGIMAFITGVLELAAPNDWQASRKPLASFTRELIFDINPLAAASTYAMFFLKTTNERRMKQ